MLLLRGKVQLDDNLAESEGKLNRFADHFEHHFVRHLSRAIGPIALAGGVFSFVERIFGKPEEIEKVSKATGFSTDEVQYLTEAARRAGLTFEDYLSRAEKKAADLGAVIKKMREDGDFQIIDKQAIKNINATSEASKAQIQAVTGKATNLVGRYIAWLRDLGYKISWQHYLEKYQPNSVAHAEMMAGNKVYYHPGQSAAAQAEAKSRGMTDYETRVFIRRQISKLQAERGTLEASKHFETLAPDLTSRQQVGAYSGAKSVVVSTLSSIDQKLADVNTQLQDWGEKLSKIDGNIETMASE